MNTHTQTHTTHTHTCTHVIGFTYDDMDCLRGNSMESLQLHKPRLWGKMYIPNSTNGAFKYEHIPLDQFLSLSFIAFTYFLLAALGTLKLL